MSVIGIDFGNECCKIGMAARGGIDIILNENSNRKNPTLVRESRERREGIVFFPIARFLVFWNALLFSCFVCFLWSSMKQEWSRSLWVLFLRAAQLIMQENNWTWWPLLQKDLL